MERRVQPSVLVKTDSCQGSASRLPRGLLAWLMWAYACDPSHIGNLDLAQVASAEARACDSEWR